MTGNLADYFGRSDRPICQDDHEYMTGTGRYAAAIPNEDALQYWRGFSPDTTDEEARAAFVARFGREPARIVRARNLVLAGPILAAASSESVP